MLANLHSGAMQGCPRRRVSIASATSARGSWTRACAARRVVSVAPRSRSPASATTVAHASCIGMPSYGHVDLAPLIERLGSSAHPALEVVPDLGSPPSVALLAGSFDPLTIGHEALSREAARRAGAVLLVWAVRSLPKEGTAPPPLLSGMDRVAILERFCAQRSGHAVG